MHKVPSILAVLFLGCFYMVHSQNLVYNPSFEEHFKCPEELGNIDDDVPHWSRSTGGTTDYFHSCSSDMGVPKNFNGYQPADFGQAYAGLYLSAPNDYREYLQGQLKQPLRAGKRYEVSFYISLADKSGYSIRDIGVLFSSNKKKVNTRKVIKFQGDISRNSKYSFTEMRNWMYFTNTKSWSRVVTTFIAKGNEKFLTIGNFRDDRKSNLHKEKGVKKAAYYYLDMVSVTLLPDEYPFNDIQVNKIYRLPNVKFKTDEYELDHLAKTELKRLFQELEKDEKLFVTIHAHTDNDGTENYNNELSTKRAKSVAAYLTGLGLPKERIRWIGHGGKQPIADNTTEDGQRKNRRAEFMISNGAFEQQDGITETLFEDGQ